MRCDAMAWTADMNPAPIVPRRVVITGMGVATALGFELEEFWQRLLSGESGIQRLTEYPDDDPLPTKIAGRIDAATLDAAMAAWDVQDPDRANQLGLVAVASALRHAGLPTDGNTPLPHDLMFGTGHGNSGFQNEAARVFYTQGYRKLRPTTVVRLMFNRPANVTSIRFNLTGGCFVVCSACATGSIALSEAFTRIRFGITDHAVAACADYGLDKATFGAWNRLGVLSRTPDPASACRPFDRDRNGLVMGEGAAAFVLETLESAQARGATILAEVLGTGMSSDASHIVKPDSAGQIRAVRTALEMAGTTPAHLDYVNAHGTATELADTVESTTLQEVLGDEVQRVPVSNTKAQLGHLMGATAGVELVVTVLAMQRGMLPCCRNLDHPDPRCPLNFVRGKPLATPVRVALKNSFAFGGTNCAVVLGRHDA
jgi:3-oxoacyl-(acyl-carrier-protein) synthase